MANPASPATLGMIRIALLGGVLLFGAVIAYLHSTGAAPDGTGSPFAEPAFTWIFIAMCAGAASAIIVLRGVAERAATPASRTPIVIAAWAVGEGVALLGGIHWLLTGGPLLYIAGLAVFVVGLATVSASA